MSFFSTFSIVACDLKSQVWGIAVASKLLSVGAVVPWAKAKTGAVATQSLANPTFGPRGLELMASGLLAEETLNKLLSRDPDRKNRQLGLVDAKGKAAIFTGYACPGWAGGLTGPGYAIQGSLIANAEIVREMEHGFLEAKGEFPERLVTSLERGSRAGGDRRGRQSAALLVVKQKAGYGGYNDRWIDVRVDDHLNPVSRLGELLELHRLYFGKSPRSQKVKLEGKVVKDIQVIMKGLGYYTPTNGEYDDATREAFRAFIENENFNTRANPNESWIDRPVLEYLMKKLK